MCSARNSFFQSLIFPHQPKFAHISYIGLMSKRLSMIYDIAYMCPHPAAYASLLITILLRNTDFDKGKGKKQEIRKEEKSE
jgi:hypothetical protein